MNAIILPPSDRRATHARDADTLERFYHLAALPCGETPDGRRVSAADYSPGLDYEDELREGFQMKYGD
jgi:hypothetical protein